MPAQPDEDLYPRPGSVTGWRCSQKAVSHEALLVQDDEYAQLFALRVKYYV